MTRAPYQALYSFLITAFFVFGIARESRALTIVFSNDVQAEIEPCGCLKTPKGGMERKVEYLKTIKGDILQLDGGNLLFDGEVTDFLREQAKVQAIYMARSYDLAGHDAVVPGDQDFALGVDFFMSIRNSTKFKFLAANLFKGKRRLLKANHVFVRKNKKGETVRIGVFGLVGSNLKLPKSLTVKDPVKVAKQQVAELSKRSDYIIALTHQGLTEDRKLAEAVKGVKLIVGGHSQSFLQRPVIAGTSVIVQAAYQNTYIGVIGIDGPNHQVDRYELVGLDDIYDPEKRTSQLAKLVDEFKAKVAEINSKNEEATKIQARDLKQSKHFQTFTSCTSCHSTQFDFWRKTPHGNALESILKAKQIRNKECLQCHSLGLGHPKGFSDVSKLASYTQDSKIQWLNPEELAAFMKEVHTAEGLQDKVTPPKGREVPLEDAILTFDHAWAPVQCENCHGPGKNHPFVEGYKKQVKTTTCLECHTPARAASWYVDGQPNLKLIEKKRKLVACPADRS